MSAIAIIAVGLIAAIGIGHPAPAHATTSGSTFVPVTASRMLDTRTTGPAVGPNSVRDLTVAGTAGIPADLSQVSDVVVNVTATGPTVSTFLTVYAADIARPAPSDLDIAAGHTTANVVITGLSASGAIAIYNHVGTVDVIVDVVGYYTPIAVQDESSTFNTVDSTRILDTRSAIGVPGTTPLGPGATLALQVEGVAEIPTSGVSAVVLNLTAVDPTVSGDLTIYPDDGSPRPTTSNVNFAAGMTIANLVIVPMPTNTASVLIFNPFGSTHVVADAVGYYTTGLGSTFHPINARILDTRTAGPGGTDAPLQANIPRPQQVAGLAGIPNDGTVSAVVLHVSIINPTATSFVVLYPDGSSRPATSNLNFDADDLMSNTVIVPLGADGDVDLYNHVGTTDAVVSVQGYFDT